MQSLQGLQSGEYKGTKRLKLSCGLSTFPQEILRLSDSLEILDLSGNPLSDLPDSISQLQNLKVAFFSDCNFTTFPRALAQCPSLEMIAFKSNKMTAIPEDSFPPKLRWLILTNNLIANLPSSIGKCHRLQKCMLAGNQLTSLPEEMVNCKKLGLLRLSCNKVTTLPPWLFTLPELAFLAFAGNPCAPSFAENPTLVDISWEELEVQHLLGEGASGIISKGLWNPITPGEEVEGNEKEKDVAVKLFKGEVTSDGSPTDEMNACITAGQHTNLISPLGKIKSHPSSSQGLVLQLIPPHYTNLGLPPNLQTCTRDNFPEGTTFTLDTCKSILLGIAEAAAHIHAKGIAHGDLYAHNILIDRMGGHALLGDFGAATIYGSEHEYSEEFERLEVLAFGFLMEDLLGLVERRVGDSVDDGNEGVFDDEKDGFLMVTLTELCESCMSNVVEERPDFEELCDVLRGL